MAVEGLKRIYEIPYIKGRVDIVKEQDREPQEKKARKNRKETTKKHNAREERPKKGIIDIVI